MKFDFKDGPKLVPEKFNDGDIAWVYTKDDNLYRFIHQGGDWQLHPMGKLTEEVNCGMIYVPRSKQTETRYALPKLSEESKDED